MTSIKGTLGILGICIWIAGIAGWIMNLVKVIDSLGLEQTNMFMFRCVGIIVAPIGCVLGYF